MGTTDRSVNKQTGKVSDTITKKAKAEKAKSNISLSAIMMALGMNFFRSGKGSKNVDLLRSNKPKHKKNQKRQQNKARATQARKNKTW